MARCAGSTRDGGQCTAIVKPPNTYCYQHDPARSNERKRNASRAGKSSGGKELKELKAELRQLTDQVLAGEIETSKVAVANQLINTRLRAVELERKAHETDELEARLRELEESITGQTGGRKWGA